MVTVEILGSRQSFAPLASVVSVVTNDAVDGRSGYYCVTNTHQVVLGHELPSFREVQEAAAASFSDSTVLALAARFLGGNVGLGWAYRGYDLFVDLLSSAAQHNLRVGFYGGTAERLEQINRKIALRLPELNVSYCYSPPFRPLTPLEFESCVRDISDSGIDLLFVGIGCPKQEMFMHRFSKVKSGPTMIGVGAAFDFYAEVVSPSPPWVHRTGLEWLYRLCSEPRRLWRRYFEYNSKFILYFTKQLVSHWYRNILRA